ALGFKPSQVVVQAAEGKFRVRLGPFPDEESARRVASRLQNEGFPGAFVVPR
ncbi:MAG: SPOR domain-containing protein, partial [Acidobacteriota bacterium]